MKKDEAEPICVSIVRTGVPIQNRYQLSTLIGTVLIVLGTESGDLWVPAKSNFWSNLELKGASSPL